MKFTTVVLLLLVTITSFGQKIERKSIPGTRLSIETFGNSSVAKHAPILNIGGKVDLNIVEMTDSAAYEKSKSDLSLENIKAQGFTVKEHRKITVDGYKGELFLVEVGTEEYGFSCYFGDPTFLAMCTAVYGRNDEGMLSQLLRAIQSLRVEEELPIDWNAFLSFNYDTSSVFQLNSDQNHNLGIQFTHNGRAQTSVYEETMVLCLQTTPAFNHYSSQDIINNYLVPQLTSMNISEVINDGQETRNETDTYLFHAKCSTEAHEFELYCRAFFYETAVILTSAYITDGKNSTEAKAFIDSISLKKDGL